MSMIMNDDWGESDSERQVRLGCEKKIESLQAEICKKDQENEQLHNANIFWEDEARRMTDAKLVFESENFRINEDNAFLRTRTKDLEQQSVKKDQELDALRKSWFTENQARELAEAEMRSEAKARMECETWIGKLEEGFIKEFTEHHASGGYGIPQKELDAMWEKDRQRAREALEKLRTG